MLPSTNSRGTMPRGPRELLDQLLLPPTDLLQLELTNGPYAGLALPLGYTIDLLAGARKALLAVAHSILDPKLDHPRLDHPAAEALVGACQIIRSHRPTLALVLGCPFEVVGIDRNGLGSQPPFTRRVTRGLMETLKLLAKAAKQHDDHLLSADTAPLLSANLCDALSLFCPPGREQQVNISAVWSQHIRVAGDLPERVELNADVFALAEDLAPRLGHKSRPQPAWYVGFVEGLDGRPGPDGRPAGLVRITITQSDELLHAYLDLPADDYAVANTAHMSSSPVYLRGVLHRALACIASSRSAHSFSSSGQPLLRRADEERLLAGEVRRLQRGSRERLGPPVYNISTSACVPLPREPLSHGQGLARHR